MTLNIKECTGGKSHERRSPREYVGVECRCRVQSHNFLTCFFGRIVQLPHWAKRKKRIGSGQLRRRSWQGENQASYVILHIVSSAVIQLAPIETPLHWSLRGLSTVSRTGLPHSDSPCVQQHRHGVTKPNRPSQQKRSIALLRCPLPQGSVQNFRRAPTLAQVGQAKARCQT